MEVEYKDMSEMIRLDVALEADAEQIRDLMIEVEKDETERWFANGERIFIPGYSSIDMQRYHMWDKRYYKIMYNDAVAGVLLISYTGREHARIDRFYIHPEFQNKGIGSKAFGLVEEIYPKVTNWSLDCIQESIRNHHFYEKNGFIVKDQDADERYYCKKVDKPSQTLKILHRNEDLSNKNIRECNLENIDVYGANMKNSSFSNINFESSVFQNANLSSIRVSNINMSGSLLGDANMEGVEICHASLANAYIHDTNLGFKEEKQPLRMERCELMDSKIANSNLSNLQISDCNIEGMRIDGILVSELINLYKSKFKIEEIS